MLSHNDLFSGRKDVLSAEQRSVAQEDGAVTNVPFATPREKESSPKSTNLIFRLGNRRPTVTYVNLTLKKIVVIV